MYPIDAKPETEMVGSTDPDPEHDEDEDTRSVPPPTVGDPREEATGDTPDPIDADPGVSEEALPLTPRQIVAELDQFIIGQDDAKKAVAIALRNRWRRKNVEGEMQEEILPNNIIMIGPTGVGKTEISRRLSRLAGAPFIKVEASKFTEVGYVGRDVESIIRDLVEIAINMVRDEKEAEVRAVADGRAEDRLLDLLLPPLAGPPEEETETSDSRQFIVTSGGQALEAEQDEHPLVLRQLPLEDAPEPLEGPFHDLDLVTD